MTGPDDEQHEHELVMPFITVMSKGGPHDDASYVAGWECARFDAHLAMAATTGHPTTIEATIQTVNLPQLDLIAMKHGYRLTSTAAKNGQGEDVPEWAFATFKPEGSEQR